MGLNHIIEHTNNNTINKCIELLEKGYEVYGSDRSFDEGKDINNILTEPSSEMFILITEVNNESVYNLEKSPDVYPGRRLIKSAPIAIPIPHIRPIAESSRILVLLPAYSIPIEDKMANTIAPHIGFMPK